MTSEIIIDQDDADEIRRKDVDIKNPLFSKTIIVGFGTIAMSIIGYFQSLDWIQQNPAAVCTLGSCMGVIMIILRFLTNKPVIPNIIIQGNYAKVVNEESNEELDEESYS